MAAKTNLFQQPLLYKYRFFIAYSFMLIMLLLILSIDINILPSGISESAMQTAAQSQTTGSLTSLEWIINAPFHALQKVSMLVFGVSRASLVLPSIVFGLATIILFLLTMRQWFRESISVIVTILAITTSPFIGMIRSATPEIMLSFWTILLLFGAVKLLIKKDKAFGWKALISVAAVGLVYTPLGIYPLVAFVFGGLLHPHVRSRIRRIALRRKIYLITIAAILLTPLVIYVVRTPDSLTTLVGWDQISQTIADPKGAVAIIYNSYFNFWNNSFVGVTLVPAFNIASVCLALLGLFRAVRESYTARSYALLTWTIVVGLVVIVVPYSTELVIMPFLLLTALGLDTLIRYWYQLFPRNPYARMAGLIPLIVLLVTISGSNLTRYFYNHQYIQNPLYLKSLSAIKNTLRREGDHAVTLVTTVPTVDFYKLLQRNYPKLAVTTELPAAIAQPIMVTPEVKKSYSTPPSRILTSYEKDNAVTLRVYRPNSQ